MARPEGPWWKWNNRGGDASPGQIIQPLGCPRRGICAVAVGGHRARKILRENVPPVNPGVLWVGRALKPSQGHGQGQLPPSLAAPAGTFPDNTTPQDLRHHPTSRGSAGMSWRGCGHSGAEREPALLRTMVQRQARPCAGPALSLSISPSVQLLNCALIALCCLRIPSLNSTNSQKTSYHASHRDNYIRTFSFSLFFFFVLPLFLFQFKENKEPHSFNLQLSLSGYVNC